MNFARMSHSVTHWLLPTWLHKSRHLQADFFEAALLNPCLTLARLVKLPRVPICIQGRERHATCGDCGREL